MKRKFRLVLFVLALSAYIITLNTCNYNENFSSTKGVHYEENNIKLLGAGSDSNLTESPSVVNTVNETSNTTGNITNSAGNTVVSNNSTSPTDTTNSSSGSNSQTGTTNSTTNSTVSGGRMDSDNAYDMGDEPSGTQPQASQSTSQSNTSTSTNSSNTQSNNSRTVKKKNSTNDSTNSNKASSNTTNTSKEENTSSPIVNNVTEKPKDSETLLVKSSIEKGDINLNDSPMLIKLSCENQNFKELYYGWSQNKEVKHEETWAKYVDPLTFNKTGVWYLHYKAIDENGNETYGYFGPYNAAHIYKSLSTNNSNETMGKKIVAYAAILVIVAVAAVYLIKTNKFTLVKKRNDEK